MKEKVNVLLHNFYVRQEFDACLELIGAHLRDVNNVSEYPLYVKALIKRHKGNIQESLSLFQAATALSPTNVENLKQVGRSLYLLGRHKAAIEVYDEAQRICPNEWELWHQKGLCFTYLKVYESAISCFQQANSIERHDVSYMQLGKIYTMQGDMAAAIQVLSEALEFSPENCEILTTIGLLHLQQGNNSRAFDYLGNSLTHDPKSAKTILAAGSIIQDHNDMDVALIKYRVAAVQTPNSAHLWNNIGMCFFGKQRYIAAIACLKKALYLDPFEWIISYNLGLVHLNTGQHASAFHFLSASILLKPDYPSTYLHLAVTLARLEDFDNACSAYEKAIEMDDQEPSFHLNYAITLLSNNEQERARQQYEHFRDLFSALDEDIRNSDPNILSTSIAVAKAVGVLPT